jgi:uncharacterized protein
MRIVRQSSYKSLPWKNGGGITHEALREPPGGEAFRYRLSIAHIDVSGPFSDFAGYQRTMVLLRGAGVVLRLGSSERALRVVGEQIEFDGALPAACELISGPCVDLNLMVAQRLGAVDARVERLSSPRSLEPGAGRQALVFPIDAPLEVEDERLEVQRERLEPWDLLILDERACQLAPTTSQPALVFVATLPRG